MKRRNLEPSKTPCDIYQLHPDEPFWCGVLLLFSCFNCPFLFQALCKVELFQNSWNTLFKLHVQSEHWACCTFCFFHTTVFDYNKKEMQLLFMSLSEIKDGLQVKTCIQVKAMLKTIFFISLPPHHQRDRFPCEKSPVKSPFIAVV